MWKVLYIPLAVIAKEKNIRVFFFFSLRLFAFFALGPGAHKCMYASLHCWCSATINNNMTRKESDPVKKCLTQLSVCFVYLELNPTNLDYFVFAAKSTVGIKFRKTSMLCRT